MQDEEAHSQPNNEEEFLNKELMCINQEDSLAKIHELLDLLPKTGTFKEELASNLKKWLILDFSSRYNFKKILLGIAAHAISTKMMSQLARGRGASVSTESAYMDSKYFNGKVTMMNPIRDFLAKEISLYNYFNKVEIINQKPLAEVLNPKTNMPAFGSQDLLISKFFHKLQDNYNVNTVPTVIRLAGKLVKPDFPSEEAKQDCCLIYPYPAFPFCPLCYGVRDKLNNLLEIGTTIRSISDGKVSEQVTSEEEWFQTEAERTLCFGCKRMALESSDKAHFLQLLPEFVKKSATEALV